ncbi:TonB-dependent receptor [Echinimonas agarilytica]|uniref:TonB-dependent receptor n=1 Tax=Echinimonas agarilytica TaxID=1215918 RepID=A0AA42B8U9_9GAMM|nr:TonB-dependent receptor [Echinimonas agarilytica]MCM2681384.1 TonB-dependent receptor [Echinimonas agarilytica]
MKHFSKRYNLIMTALLALPVTSTHAQEIISPASDTTNDVEIERIVVHSDFRASSVEEMPGSVSVIDAVQLEDEGAQHFSDVLNSIANLNWSGGSSRPRYFQIRGVGEQAEYQGAPNSSVGFIYDDIDLSGIGMTTSMFDIEQVEVLRGPQGTRYGANALAGLIYVKSNDPTDTFEHGVQLSAGDDNLKEFSGYSSGPISDQLQYRVALQQHSQDGFVDNKYRNQDDTNERDEFTARGKLRLLANEDTTIDVTYLHANFDNGYDVWTLDNNGYDTLTDRPGEDTQRTNAASVRMTFSQAQSFDVTSLTSYAKSNHRHAYDGDWASPEYWASKACESYDDDWNVIGSEPCVYDYWWDKDGDRETWSQEVRFTSTEQGRIFNDTTDWLVGVYGMKLDESNDLTVEQRYSLEDESRETLNSEYDATNLAIFGQLDSDLGYGYGLSVGVRIENRESDYTDSAGESFDPSETMWGGHISLAKEFTAEHQGYVKVARGYKAGGFNMSLPESLSDNKEFDKETLYNYELGLKSLLLNNSLISNLAVFYMDRQDQQVESSIQEQGSGDFWLFTTNATSSRSYGLEWDVNWQATENLTVYGSLGLLDAQYDDYQYEDDGDIIDLTDRDLAHAPHSTYSLGATYLFNSGWFANLNGSGKTPFYYSDSHESRSDTYTIVNARVGYETELWSVYLWGKNLSDEEYGVRGFYFGNEPDQGWTDKQYIRYGDPRQIGVTFALDLD